MKNYVIIGGSSGIGLQLTKQLASLDHKVVATYNKTNPSFEHENVTYHSLDVTEATNEFDFLPDSIDGLVYCPGSINLKPFHRIKPEQFTEDFELQVGGAIRVIQKALPNLKAAGNSAILFYSTVAVQSGFNFHAQVAASKGAIEGLTRALSAEFAPTIRVNCIAPSLTDTPLAAKLLSTDEKKAANAQRHPMKKIGTVEDLAEMSTFLLSDKSKWITGQIFHVDGGMSVIKS